MLKQITHGFQVFWGVYASSGRLLGNVHGNGVTMPKGAELL